MSRRLRAWMKLGLAPLLAQCEASAPQPSALSAPLPSAAPTSSEPATGPEAATQVPIPAGAFEAGTPAGLPREPALEPIPYRAELGSFRIDAHPYPNDPKRAPLRTDAQTAARLCAERSGRLCTELEWERSCRGPANTLYASGEHWDETCSHGRCASGFNVYGLGATAEWTASRVSGHSPLKNAHAVRGGAPDQEDAARHCSARRAAQPAERELAFRCCYGSPNAARVPEPEPAPLFEKLTWEPKRLSALLSQDPRTAALSKELSLFAEPEAINTVIARGPGNRMGFDFTTQPLLWRPDLGSEFLVWAAKSGPRKSFVLVYERAGSERYALHSSFILEKEPGPVILAYSPSIRPRMHFSSCWGCPGENGKILFRKPNTVVILQP